MSQPDNDRNERTSNSGWVGPIEWMARNSIAANLLMIILLVGGAWSAYTIQKEVFPDAALDVVDVSVQYPGASPSEVETGILLPVEEAVRGVEGIKEMTSTAREGSGSISLELLSSADRQQVFQEIDQEVSRIRTFPDEAEEPEVQLQDESRDVIEIGMYGDVDLWVLRDLAENVRDQLLQKDGITQLGLEQVPDFVTHVEIDRNRLRAHDLSISDVAQIIEQSSRDVPAGDVDTANGEILLRMQERKQWADEYANIPILTSSTGSQVTLGDLATVRDGFEETPFYSAWNGQPSISLEVFRTGDQTPLEVSETVINTMEQLEPSFPHGVQYRVDSNRADTYYQRLSLLLENGFYGILIVLVILSLFLEHRHAFWVMMGMVISFVGAILFLPLFGVSINMISMFAFLVVLGIVVDDAIIVGENVYEYRQRGMETMEAAIKGAQDMAGPVTFSILSNIVAFVPLFFIPGTMGNFWWPIPAVVITVLAISLIEALFILPAHLGHQNETDSSGFGAWFRDRQKRFSTGFHNWVQNVYKPWIHTFVRYRYLTTTFAVVLFIVTGTYAMSDHMGMIMMPDVSADEIEANARLPEDTVRDQALRKLNQVTEATRRIYEEYDLEQSAEGIQSNLWGTTIDVEIVMKPPGERERSVQEVTNIWRNNLGSIPGIRQITFSAESGPGSWRDDISVDLNHSDIDVLEEASQVFFNQLESFPTTTGVNDNYEPGKKQLDFTLLPEGRNLGLTSADVGQQLRGNFYGELALRQLRGTNEVEVRVKLPEEQRDSLYTVMDLVLQTPDGIEVPIQDVANVEMGRAYNSIDRRNGRRIITVGTDVEPKSQISTVLSRLQSDVLPELRTKFPGLSWTFEGGQAEMQKSTQVLFFYFGLAMLVIYALIAIAFRSYLQPIIVMGAIPFGIIGAVMGHLIMGFNLSLISLMGVVALSGVVVNDSLIMVDYANKQRDELEPLTAITEAGARRFRPILLTTLTTFGGLSPMILETSIQAQYMIPMAISLGFGILFATTIILVLVPCLYMISEDLLGALSLRN